MAGRKQAGEPRGARQATAAEAAALAAVYEKLAALLDALRDARGTVHHEALLALINEQIDRQLEADDTLRSAIVEFTGKPVIDPY
jgi:hypothetical protein